MWIPFGFQELPGFLKPENYLKAAEMAMEDDYGMIDGVINNGKKEETGGESIGSGSAEGKAGGCAACAASQVLRRKGVINAFYG